MKLRMRGLSRAHFAARQSTLPTTHGCRHNTMPFDFDFRQYIEHHLNAMPARNAETAEY